MVAEDTNGSLCSCYSSGYTGFTVYPIRHIDSYPNWSQLGYHITSSEKGVRPWIAVVLERGRCRSHHICVCYNHGESESQQKYEVKTSPLYIEQW